MNDNYQLIPYKEVEPIHVFCDSITLPNPYILIFNKKKKHTKIALVMMVKNEELRIHVSLTSVLGFVDKFLIYDTGSSDNTINIIIQFCLKYKVELHLLQGQFENFSTSRNFIIAYSDKLDDIDFILLLDCNDELQFGNKLIKFCQNVNEEFSGFFLMQRWRTSIFIDYINIRLVKTRHNWRYKGLVHEYIKSDHKNSKTCKVPEVVLYQDRTKDDDKSYIRFSRDKEILLTEYNSDEKTPRTVYYLAQTFECLGDRDNAIKYYNERMYMEDFYEEKYQAAYHIGQLMRDKNEPFEKYSGFYLKALEIMYRVEPLVRIAEYYISKRVWIQAFFFLKEACKLKLVECGLFVDSEMYNYYRWHLMGIVAFYVKEYNLGLKACEIAISQRNNNIDIHNMNFYKSQLSGLSNIEKLDLL
jgi:hypothetical protein